MFSTSNTKSGSINDVVFTTKKFQNYQDTLKRHTKKGNLFNKVNNSVDKNIKIADKNIKITDKNIKIADNNTTK